jgi:hypothetical protein
VPIYAGEVNRVGVRLQLRAKKLLFILIFSLVTSGILSYFYFNNLASPADMAVQDLSFSSGSNMVTFDIHVLAAPVSSGTAVLFPGILTKAFSPSTIFALVLGTVAAERKNDERAPKLRDLIVSEISQSPGIHLRELHRSIGCAMGALQYHLKYLEDTGQLVTVKVGNSKHFFDADYSDDMNVLTLCAMSRNPTIRTILEQVFEEGRVTQADLSRKMTLDKSLISYYTGSLLDAGILNTVRVFGRERPLVLTDWAHSTIETLALV